MSGFGAYGISSMLCLLSLLFSSLLLPSQALLVANSAQLPLLADGCPDSALANDEEEDSSGRAGPASPSALDRLGPEEVVQVGGATRVGHMNLLTCCLADFELPVYISYLSLSISLCVRYGRWWVLGLCDAVRW